MVHGGNRTAVQPSPSLTEMLRALEHQNRPLQLGEGDVHTTGLFNLVAIEMLKGAIATLSDGGMERSLIALAEDAIRTINRSTMISVSGKNHVAMEILALFNGPVATVMVNRSPSTIEPVMPKDPPVRLVIASSKPKRRKSA